MKSMGSMKKSHPRYPDDLQNLLKVYNKAKTRKVLDKGKEVLKWLQAKL